MSGHTPGPWWADAEGCEIFSASANGRVAMVGERSDVEVERANARLIAAAPALLEAAQKSLALLEKGAMGWGVSKDLLRAAIAKATGAP